jgi:hypothetical protein
MARRRLSPGSKRRWWAIVGLLALSIAWSTGWAAADDRIVVQVNTFSYEFGRNLNFHLEAGSPAEIKQILLTYGPVGQSTETVTVQPVFTSAAHVALDYAHDLITRRFQAFSQLEYYWVVIDSRGQRLQTPPVRFEYTDNRFQWQTLEEDGVTVAWYGRRQIDGRAALYDAQLARAKIAAVTGGNPRQAFRVYIYSTAADLQVAAQVDRQEWVVGQAYPRIATCLVLIPEDGSSAIEMRRVIPHEISHLLIGDLAAGLPRWLDEGLATDNEGIHDPRAGTALADAAREGQLLSFEQLCAHFPANPQQAALAYAQSGDLVAFIRAHHNSDSLQRLVAAYRETPDCEAGLRSALGLTLAQLQAEWESSLPERRPNLGDTLRVSVPWLALWLGSGLIILLALPSVRLHSGRLRGEPAAPMGEADTSSSATRGARESGSK